MTSSNPFKEEELKKVLLNFEFCHSKFDGNVEIRFFSKL